MTLRAVQVSTWQEGFFWVYIMSTAGVKLALDFPFWTSEKTHIYSGKLYFCANISQCRLSDTD